MMKRFLLLIGSLMMYTAVYADANGDHLQKKLNVFKSMTAHFSQMIHNHSREISRSSGDMALKRPGQFRWNTRTPMSQLVVADGKKLWIYDVDLEQVTVQKQESSVGGSAALFLSGYNETAAKSFQVKSVAEGKTTTFDLRALSDKENFQRILLTFNGDLLQNMILFDQLGQKTSIKFTDVKNNPNLSETLFHFSPPKGVDIIKQ